MGVGVGCREGRTRLEFCSYSRRRRKPMRLVGQPAWRKDAMPAAVVTTLSRAVHAALACSSAGCPGGCCGGAAHTAHATRTVSGSECACCMLCGCVARAVPAVPAQPQAELELVVPSGCTDTILPTLGTPLLDRTTTMYLWHQGGGIGRRSGG